MASEKRALPKPNYTGIPNALFEVMPLMKEAELRVVLAICRQTFGWHRDKDCISISQLEEMTGLNRTSILRGIKQGIERGLIKRREVKKGDKEKGFYYSLVVAESNYSEDDEWLLKATTSSSAKQLPPTPEVVALSNPQKKEKETLKKTDSANGSRPPSEHQAIIAAYVEELTYTPPNMGREAKAAKWLVDNHFSPAEVIACYRHMKKDRFWADKFLSLQKISEQIAEFTRRNQPAGPETRWNPVTKTNEEKIGGQWYTKTSQRPA